LAIGLQIRNLLLYFLFLPLGDQGEKESAKLIEPGPGVGMNPVQVESFGMCFILLWQNMRIIKS